MTSNSSRNEKVDLSSDEHFSSHGSPGLLSHDEHGSQWRALRRKIDWRIMPLMFACYFLQFLDKVILNYAAIMGLTKDLKMTTNQFSWTATSFFIAYAVAEIPQGILLQRFPVSKVLGANVLCWGIILCCTSAVNDTASLIALRTLLGAFEAVISPALIMVTATFYTKREAGPRYGFWYCGLGAGQLIGGLISWAAQHGSTIGFSGWRIMFVAVGAANLVIAISVLLFLPDSLDSATFLTQDEKKLLATTLAIDQGGSGRKKFNPSSLWELAGDLQIWLLVLLTLLTCEPSGVITTFSSTIIRNLGYTSKQSALLGMPNGLVSILATLVSTAAILYNFPRWLSICILLVPAIIGAGLMSFLPKGDSAALAGIYLINATVAPLALIYSWVGGNVAGYTKKIGANAAVSVAFGLANIIGPQTFRTGDAPQYLPAKVTLFAVDGAAIGVAVLLRVLYGRRNVRSAEGRKRELEQVRRGRVGEEVFVKGADVTDGRNEAFTYVY